MGRGASRQRPSTRVRGGGSTLALRPSCSAHLLFCPIPRIAPRHARYPPPARLPAHPYGRAAKSTAASRRSGVWRCARRGRVACVSISRRALSFGDLLDLGPDGFCGAGAWGARTGFASWRGASPERDGPAFFAFSLTMLQASQNRHAARQSPACRVRMIRQPRLAQPYKVSARGGMAPSSRCGLSGVAAAGAGQRDQLVMSVGRQPGKFSPRFANGVLGRRARGASVGDGRSPDRGESSSGRVEVRKWLASGA